MNESGGDATARRGRRATLCGFRSGEYWQGAAANTDVSHVAIQESLDSRNADWLERVSNEQYRQ